MDLNLQGKRAMVCGSTQGIGKAVAMELAELGADVTLVARNEDRLKQVAGELPKTDFQDHNYLVADFSKPGELSKALEGFVVDEKPYSILVNNTGGPPSGPAMEADVEEFRVAFNNHLVCNHILAKSLVGGMKKIGYGRIINIISTSVKTPLPRLTVSNTTRGAVASWAKSLANELGQFNITVNNVLPGPTDTERLTELVQKMANDKGAPFEQFMGHFTDSVPMGRIGQPSEIANAVAFLASPAASFINGINVPVDGGRTASL